MLSLVVLEGPQELAELLADERLNVLLLEPRWQVLFLLGVVVHVVQIVRAVVVVVVLHAHLAAHVVGLGVGVAHFPVLRPIRYCVGLSHPAALHLSALQVVLPLGLAPLLRVHDSLLHIVDAILFVAVKFRPLFVVLGQVVRKVVALALGGGLVV